MDLGAKRVGCVVNGEGVWVEVGVGDSGVPGKSAIDERAS